MNKCRFCGKDSNKNIYCSKGCKSEDYKIRFSGENNPFYGKKHGEKSLGEMSQKHKGKYPTKETRMKLSDSKRGCKNPNFGKHNTGRKDSEETKEKKRITKLGNKNPMYGKHHTEEHNKKIGVSLIGKHKGWKHTEETKIKIRIARSKQKMSYPRANTSIEIKIQNYVKELGEMFETQKSILGHPDIFLPEYNLCIFPDGDYFHANPNQYKNEQIIKFPGGKLKKSNELWNYDKDVTTKLENQGYAVLRFWENDINNNFEWVKSVILDTINCIRVMS